MQAAYAHAVPMGLYKANNDMAIELNPPSGIVDKGQSQSNNLTNSMQEMDSAASRLAHLHFCLFASSPSQNYHPMAMSKGMIRHIAQLKSLFLCL